MLVLGSSLQIVPAGNLPLLCKKNGGRVVSVNLQKTKHHNKTDLNIHSHIDKVLSEVCARLEIAIPRYSQPNPVLTSSHTDYKGPNDYILVGFDDKSAPLKRKWESDGVEAIKERNDMVDSQENKMTTQDCKVESK